MAYTKHRTWKQQESPIGDSIRVGIHIKHHRPSTPCSYAYLLPSRPAVKWGLHTLTHLHNAVKSFENSHRSFHAGSV